MPKFNEFLFGKKGKTKQVSTVSPEQQQLIDLINQGIMKGEGDLAGLFNFDEEAFQKGVQDPALKNFKENILPQIQEKFIAGNQVLGSGMRRGQTKAATDMQSNIDQLRYQAQQDAAKNKMAAIQQMLGMKTFENVYQPGTQGVVQGVVQGAAEGFGNAVGAGINPFGAATSTASKAMNWRQGGAQGASTVAG